MPHIPQFDNHFRTAYSQQLFSVNFPAKWRVFFSLDCMNSQHMLVTESGLAQLNTELSDLNLRRPQIVERLSLARSMGDLSENSDYISAKEELAFIDGRIAELEDLIKSAKVVTPTTNGQVDLGNKVTLDVNGKQVLFHIVGEWEADPSQKKISNSSPLGLALMGRKVGEQVEVEAPVGKIKYTVVAIA